MSLTPMMQQYQAAKAAAGDALLLFRMGDFYELFDEDAKTAARVLGLTLTSREKGENAMPMAGFPHHQLDGYLAKIIAAGMRAAVCEQVEDPKKAKGLVKREVTRVVTPGTVTDDALLGPAREQLPGGRVSGERGRKPPDRTTPATSLSHQGAYAPRSPTATVRGARSKSDDRIGLAWIDLSTGKFQAAVVPSARLPDELARIQPAECLVAESSAEGNGAVGRIAHRSDPLSPQAGLPVPPALWGTKIMVTRRPDWSFSQSAAREALGKQLGTASLEGFGFTDDDGPAIAAAGAILDYLDETQKSHAGPRRSAAAVSAGPDARHRRVEPPQPGDHSDAARGPPRGLAARGHRPHGHGHGLRLLADWLAAPLTEVAAIEARLDAVGELVTEVALADWLRDQLKEVYDVQRLLARVTTRRATPRDLGFIGRTLRGLPPLKAKLTARKSALLNHLEVTLDLCPELRQKLDAALVDDCPLTTPRGRHHSRRVIMPSSMACASWPAAASSGSQSYQRQEIERTGIPSLKVGFNKVFGYYIEVTNAHRDKVPATLHPQADDQERRALHHAGAEGVRGEGALGRREGEGAGVRAVRRAARRWWPSRPRRLQADGRRARPARRAGGLAELARQRGYCRPTLVDEPVLDDRRRPAPGARPIAGDFVPNDACGARVRSSRSDHAVTGPQLNVRTACTAPDHRPQHGRQEHLHPPGGAAHAHGPDRQLRAGRAGDDRRRRPHLRPHRRQRRAVARAKHVHGRDDRDGQHPQHRHRRGAW